MRLSFSQAANLLDLSHFAVYRPVGDKQLQNATEYFNVTKHVYPQMASVLPDSNDMSQLANEAYGSMYLVTYVSVCMN